MSGNTKIEWVLDESEEALKGLRLLFAVTLTPVLLLLSKIGLTPVSLSLLVKIMLSFIMVFLCISAGIVGSALVKTMLLSTELRTRRRQLISGTDVPDNQVDLVVEKYWKVKRPWLSPLARFSAIAGYALIVLLIIFVIWFH